WRHRARRPRRPDAGGPARGAAPGPRGGRGRDPRRRGLELAALPPGRRPGDPGGGREGPPGGRPAGHAVRGEPRARPAAAGGADRPRPAHRAAGRLQPSDLLAAPGGRALLLGASRGPGLTAFLARTADGAATTWSRPRPRVRASWGIGPGGGCG